MSNNSKEWALAKIKKCLALFAKASGNEAATALRQAKVLMQKYCISDADIDASHITEFLVKIGKGSKNPPQWQSRLATTCAQAFDCKSLILKKYNNNKRVKYACFIGLNSSSELASYTFEILEKQLKRDRKDYLKTMHPSCLLTTRRRRADLFADSWVSAVLKLVCDFAQNHESLKLIDSYIDEKYNPSTITLAPKTTSKRYDSARLAGAEAGRNAKLHHAMKHHKNKEEQLTIEGVC